LLRKVSTVDYPLAVACNDYLYDTSWSLHNLTTGAVEAASGFKRVTEFCYLLSQSVGLVPRDEYQLLILDSVGSGICRVCGGRSAAIYATVNECNGLITSGNGVPVMSSTKRMRNVSSIVSPTTSASQSQPGLSPKARETDRFIPVRCSLAVYFCDISTGNTTISPHSSRRLLLK
jgi:hypothetical protein